MSESKVIKKGNYKIIQKSNRTDNNLSIHSEYINKDNEIDKIGGVKKDKSDSQHSGRGSDSRSDDSNRSRRDSDPRRTYYASRGRDSREDSNSSRGSLNSDEYEVYKIINRKKQDNNRELENAIHDYLSNLRSIDYNDLLNDVFNKNGIPEFEVRFFEKGIYNQSLTKFDCDNVVKYLTNTSEKEKYSIKNTEMLLRSHNEYTNPNTGKKQISNIRLELSSFNDIKKMCSNENIKNMKSRKYVQKKDFDLPIKPIDYHQYGFRVSVKKEIEFVQNESGNFTYDIINDIENNWGNNKKIFRYLNRVTYSRNDGFPFIIQISTVKESHKRGKFMIPEYTFLESEVLESTPKYEIEIELSNKDIYRYYYKTTRTTRDEVVIELKRDLQLVIMKVLCGIHQSKFPLERTVAYEQMCNYLSLTKNDIKYNIKRNNKSYIETLDRLINNGRFNFKTDIKTFSKDFIGPSSLTLQLSNIINTDESDKINVDTPNIRKKYTVTEKADGERKLLYINPTGNCYLIDTNMNIQFTGMTNNILINTLIDGEHILHDKNGRFINLYVAFDIYFLDNQDKRSLEFISNEPNILQSNFRLLLLKSTISNTSFKNVDKNVRELPMRIEVKKFYYETDDLTIFDCCNEILTKESDGMFEYNVDGLIFTPMDKPIPISTNKITWNYSLKWKPPKYNTIDFLISTKKNQLGQDIKSNIFKSGIDSETTTNIGQYKTLTLRVGFDTKRDGYLNPCNDIYEDNIPKFNDGDVEDEQEYKPVPFYPTNPYDNEAHICNILLKNDTSGEPNVMITEEGEVFEDNMIVEFYYDNTRDNHWRWVPLRVRQDKTSELRSGQKNYGNAYRVANSNWHTIHYPITEEMIKTGNGIPNELGDDDIYYNKIIGESKTRALRDFHNLFVKRKLIMSVSKRGDYLIDYAAGKGGDLPKWIASRLSFVLGIDISKDNIENRIDGICARYLNYCKKNRDMPNSMFFHGNSGKNIKNMDAFYDDKSKILVKALFGEGPKDINILGKGVYKMYGIASEGFNVSSIQFAIHYMFENGETLNNFLRNLSECTKVNGYFIGTCYDGETIFNLLDDKEKDETISIYDNGKKIWEIKKSYSNNIFNDDSTSIGYAIDIYQETINKVFREYLVNFNYLSRLLENYGFVLISKEEAKQIGLINGTGMFNELFTSLKNEVKRNPDVEKDYGFSLNMSDGEKRISFLNRYFIFKKIRNVDSEIISKKLVKSVEQEKEQQREEKQIEKETEQKANEEYLKVIDERIPLTPSTSAEKVVIKKYKIKKVKGKKIKLI